MVQRAIDILEYFDSTFVEVSPLGALPDADLGGALDNIFRPHVLNGSAVPTVPIVGFAPDTERDGLEVELLPVTDTVGVDSGSGVELFDSSFPSYDADGVVLVESDEPLPDRRPAISPQGRLSSFGFINAGGPLGTGSLQSTNPGVNRLFAPDASAFNGGPSFSLSFWLRPTENLNQVQLFGKGINAPGQPGWGIANSWNGGINGRLWLETEGPSNNSMGSTALGGGYTNFDSPNNQFILNSWCHFVVSCDFTDPAAPVFLLYRDGVLLSTGTNVGSFQPTRHDNGQPFTVFGGHGFYQGDSYNTTINMIDLHYWATEVLSASDAATLYNGGVPILGLDGVLAFEPRFVYSLRNLSSGLLDLAGNCPSLVNQGCIETTEFPP